MDNIAERIEKCCRFVPKNRNIAKMIISYYKLFLQIPFLVVYYSQEHQVL